MWVKMSNARHNLRDHAAMVVLSWDSPLKFRFARDSPLEGSGFEPSVPAVKTRFSEERPGAQRNRARNPDRGDERYGRRRPLRGPFGASLAPAITRTRHLAVPTVRLPRARPTG